MKIKLIMYSELETALSAPVYTALFQSTRCSLLINTDPKTKRVWFSVVERKPLKETDFETIEQAAELFNSINEL